MKRFRVLIATLALAIALLPALTSAHTGWHTESSWCAGSTLVLEQEYANYLYRNGWWGHQWTGEWRLYLVPGYCIF